MNLFGTTGQERRAWINNQGDRFANALNYYLGPTGIPDKLNALAQAAEFTDAGDFMEAGDASRALVRDPSISNAARMSAAGAALAIPFVSARMMNEGTDILGSVVDDFMTGYDPNRLNMFAGPTARTADRNALAPAEARAQEVLDLLASGRAAEVTDEMMAAADPQYLFRNYDLPMDEASRMGRAREMGFGDARFHGTGGDFQAFDLRRVGQANDQGFYGRGVYATPDPQHASDYVPFTVIGNDDGIEFRPGGSVMPVVMRNENPVEWNASSRASADATQADVDLFAPNIEVARGGVPEWAVGQFTDKATGAGRTGVRVSVDGNGLMRGGLHEEMVFDPRNIRSRFARFDPRLSHLRNLSAGAAGTAILANSGTEEERSNDIRALLDKYGVQY